MKGLMVAYLRCTCGNVMKDKGKRVVCGACGKVLAV